MNLAVAAPPLVVYPTNEPESNCRRHSVGGLGIASPVRWGSSVLHGRNHRGPPHNGPQRPYTYVIVLGISTLEIQFFWIHFRFLDFLSKK
jgi:hypothetical protein